MGTTVSLDEYLNTSYRPDMDFVDGELVERNVGTQSHGRLMCIAASFLSPMRKSHRVETFLSVRLLVNRATGRHRIPDVMAVGIPYQRGKVITDVPLIIVEIKSPDDTFDDILERCLDYEKLQVPHILVMDPENRRTWKFVDSGLLLVTSESIDLPLPAGTLSFPASKLLAELDED